MGKSELLTRGFMVMTFVAAALLLAAQWYDRAPNQATGEPAPVTRKLPPSPQPIRAAIAEERPAPEPVVSLASLAEALPRPAVLPAGQTVRSLRPVLPRKPLSLLVDLSDRRVYVYKFGQPMVSYPVAIGQSGWETPVGSFRITTMEKDPFWQHPITGELLPPGPKNPLGSRWIGFWSGPEFDVGFHGTYRTDSVGLAASHGCLRMFEEDVRALYETVQVGTVVTVRQ